MEMKDRRVDRLTEVNSLLRDRYAAIGDGRLADAELLQKAIGSKLCQGRSTKTTVVELLEWHDDAKRRNDPHELALIDEATAFLCRDLDAQY